MQPTTNTILFSKDEERFEQLNYMFRLFVLEGFFLGGGVCVLYLICFGNEERCF